MLVKKEQKFTFRKSNGVVAKILKVVADIIDFGSSIAMSQQLNAMIII